jgi:salicylate hydroxylase
MALLLLFYCMQSQAYTAFFMRCKGSGIRVIHKKRRHHLSRLFSVRIGNIRFCWAGCSRFCSAGLTWRRRFRPVGGDNLHIMQTQAVISGGGIGGLAAALALGRRGVSAALFEQSPVFSEVGAGIQLGPNAVRVLQSWGLSAPLARVAAYPQALVSRDALSGDALACLHLGGRVQARYGAPYCTAHRADLHRVLLDAVGAMPSVRVVADRRVFSFREVGDAVSLMAQDGAELARGHLLVGADGLWSTVRAQLLQDGQAQPTGHLAYRALVPQIELPQTLRSQAITAWLGPALHVVAYPVRGGEWLNVVAIVQGPAPDDPTQWDHSANAADLQYAVRGCCPALRDLLAALPSWRLWPLSDRVPLRSAREQAQGRVALLGDAAHPMRPYLAQGAAMALEDAEVLARCLVQAPARGVPVALADYAAQRWRRNAQVQARARRNGQLFHAQGVARAARNAGLRLLGPSLMDLPWLYAGGPCPV